MPIYPKEYLSGKGGLAPIHGHCFVLMPFKSTFDDVFGAMRGACEATDTQVECLRADDLYGSGSILEGILDKIFSSEFVVADVTGQNSNVF